MSRRTAFDDTGAVAVVVALCLVMLMMFVALAVDVGYMYGVRRQLQSAADAAALAGCQVLIQSGDAEAAEVAARDYAERNATGPAADLTVTAVDVNIDAETGWVRVEVSSQAQAFFSQVWPGASSSNPVVAAAKAQKQRVSGGRFLVPWAIPIVKNTDEVHAEAWIGSGSKQILSRDPHDSLHFYGSITVPSAGSHDVFAQVYNSQGFPEILAKTANAPESDIPVGCVTVAPEIDGIELDPDFVSTDGGDRHFPTTLTVRTRQQQSSVKAKFGQGNSKTPMTGSADGKVWTLAIAQSDVSVANDLLQAIPIEIFIGSNQVARTYLHVRRSTLPYDRIAVTPQTVTAAEATVVVDVYLSPFTAAEDLSPGGVYSLRVESSGVFGGNFGVVDFATLVHDADCAEIVPNSVNYRDAVANGYEGGVHVGDVISTQPGDKGANTASGLQDRSDLLPAGETMVVTVPVVEKITQDLQGNYRVVVVGLASFEIMSWGKGNTAGAVTGRFVEYTSNPDGFEGGAGSPGDAYAARLVNP